MNKYPTVGAASLTYDGNKNLTSDGTWTYTYDTENHLLTAAAGAVSASYVYDPSGKQAQKTVGAVKTRFIYDGVDLIATYDAAGVLQNRYVHGPDMDEPAIQVTAAGVLSFFHRDFQGSIVALTNNSGAVTNKYTYSPFGESVALSGTIYGYTGQRYDAETGLYYYKARHFSPVLGRFLQTDPIGYAGGDLNLYAYVGNDPVNYRDPLGLALFPKPGQSTNPDVVVYRATVDTSVIKAWAEYFKGLAKGLNPGIPGGGVAANEGPGGGGGGPGGGDEGIFGNPLAGLGINMGAAAGGGGGGDDPDDKIKKLLKYLQELAAQDPLDRHGDFSDPAHLQKKYDKHHVQVGANNLNEYVSAAEQLFAVRNDGKHGVTTRKSDGVIIVTGKLNTGFMGRGFYKPNGSPITLERLGAGD